MKCPECLQEDCKSDSNCEVRIEMQVDMAKSKLFEYADRPEDRYMEGFYD